MMQRVVGVTSLRVVALVAAMLSTAAARAQPTAQDSTVTRETQQATTPADVLSQLKEGNERFLHGAPRKRDAASDIRATAGGQHPTAAVLGCIDSRVPVETVLDAGIGDMFVARVAGNVADSDIVGSLEYATKVVGAKLVLVMGHTRCGAVKSACEHVELGNITGLLQKIAPAVDAVKGVPGGRDCKNEAFVDAAAQENVRLTMRRLREMSPILKGLEDSHDIMIVGAVYDIGTGKVDFLDDEHASGVPPIKGP
jgi:carbonic anhydrase